METRRIEPGMACEASEKVTSDLTAGHIGSGNLRVYATPAMVRFIELTCFRMLEPMLERGQTTVGVAIRLRHIAPTPIDATVHQRAEIASLEGNLIIFKVRLRDEKELIGEGEHRRAIIEVERFLQRVRSKSRGG